MEEKAVSDETTDDIPELEENDVKEILHELLNELLLKGQEIGNSGDGEAVKHPPSGKMAIDVYGQQMWEVILYIIKPYS